MPRTKIQKRVPDFSVFQETVRGQMRKNRVPMRDAGSKSRPTYYRYFEEPWKIKVCDLAQILIKAGFTQEEQEEVVLGLYRETQKKVG